MSRDPWKVNIVGNDIMSQKIQEKLYIKLYEKEIRKDDPVHKLAGDKLIRIFASDKLY